MKIEDYGHRRYNPLTGEWLVVSPFRAKRPWQGKHEDNSSKKGNEYVDDCYLCPGNIRAGGIKNPDYNSTFVFVNDFSALQNEEIEFDENISDLLVAKSERGICKVVCFSPKHNLTLAEMDVEEITNVIKTWQTEFSVLGSLDFINYVQIFENKGEIMGCSNPHPHGQIWAQQSLPVEVMKENHNQRNHYIKYRRTLLSDYLKIEMEKKDRIVYENDNFVLLVPFWAIWPFETMIISKEPLKSVLDFSESTISQFADIIKVTTVKYDNIFNISFPYSAGIHQAPTDGNEHPEWHFHMHFYPPLLRSATIKKFMVGYELLAEPQRDIVPEKAAELLKQASSVHYSKK